MQRAARAAELRAVAKSPASERRGPGIVRHAKSCAAARCNISGGQASWRAGHHLVTLKSWDIHAALSCLDFSQARTGVLACAPRLSQASKLVTEQAEPCKTVSVDRGMAGLPACAQAA